MPEDVRMDGFRAAYVLTALIFLAAGSATAGKNVLVGADSLDCPRGVCLIFKGEMPRDAEQGLVGEELAIDNKVVAEANGRFYSFEYRTTSCGDYSTRIRAILQGNKRAILTKGWLKISEDTQCGLRFSGVKTRGINTLELRPAARVLSNTIKVTLMQRGQMLGSQVVEFKNGVYPVSIAGADYGEIEVFAEVIAGGCHYISPSYRTAKNRPIDIQVDRTTLDLAVNEPVLKLQVKIGEVNNPRVKLLMLGGQLIGERELRQGDNELRLDVSDALSNTYSMYAVLTEDSTDFKSPTLTVQVKNAKGDEKAFKHSLYWGKVQSTALARKKLDERHRILAGAADVLDKKLGKPMGMKGVIRGLCVLSGPYLEIGETLPIQLAVRPSRDLRLIWNNSAVDLDAKLSLMNALLFAQQYIRRSVPGFNVDDYEYTVTMGSGGAIGGDSAGAALATLLISYFTGIRIRSDVAITGTVDANGRIGEVGGYADKSFAAFVDPYVTTLIIPRTPQAIYESTQIGLLVATHRVVAASSMEQVLRHALVTDNVSKWICEGQWMEALRLFKEKQTSRAMTRLQSLHAEIPEDLTCSLWWNWLLDENKLINEVDFNDRWIAGFRKDNPEVLEDLENAGSPFKLISPPDSASAARAPQ